MTRTGDVGDRWVSLIDVCGVCGTEQPDSADRVRLRQSARRIGAAYHRAVETGDLEEFSGLLLDAVKKSNKTLTVWLELLEEIAQLAERRYGTASGQGKYKAEQVKASLRAIIAGSGQADDNALVALGPGAIDAVIDVGLAVVVGLLDARSQLWLADNEVGVSPRQPWRLRFILWCAPRFGRIYGWFVQREPLDPELRDEIQRIIDAGAGPVSVFGDVLQIAAYIVEHRTLIEALMEAIATATEEAETFSALSNPEKQTYVRELILIVLEEQFGIVFSGVFRAVAESVIDSLIDFVVSINKVRPGGFQHPAT